MLDAGRAPEQIAGVTVFFDHADERRRYVLAEAPRLVADPDPRLSLVLYRGTSSGGLLQFESTLAPSAAQLEAVAARLSERGPAPTLARPDWRRGTVRVAGWLQAAELAPTLLVVGTPSLVADPVAAIAARLDAAGAALADSALRGNALPTVVLFELETLGLAGPLGIEAEADLQAIHDRLTAEGALTTPYGRARIKGTWESAARDNLIRVRVVDESGDVESQRAEAMRRIGEDLLARMFSPFPPPERPPQLGDDTVAPIELSFRLTVRREELSTSSRWNFRERRAIAIRHHAAASLVDLLGRRDPSAFISFADLQTFTRSIVVRIEPELARLGLAALEVDVRSPGGGVERTFVLTDAEPEVRIEAERTGAPLEYRVRTRFDPAVARAADMESGWQRPVGDLVVVSARRLFPPRSLTIIAGRAELDWIERVDLLVRAPGQPPRSLSLTKDEPSAEVLLPAAGGQSIAVDAVWRGGRDEPVRADPPREIDDDIVVLDSPFGDSINLVAAPLPAAGVSSIVAELKTEFEGFRHSRTIAWDETDRAPRRVALRRLTGSPRVYQYRIQVIRSDGTIDEQPWRESDAPTLVAGPAPSEPVSVRTAEVVLLGGGPARRGSFAVELALEAGPHRVAEVLEGERDSATLVLVAPRGAPVPTLTAREFLDTGGVRETVWPDPSPLIVIPPVPLVV